MLGHRFIKFDPNENAKSKFDELLNLFLQLLTHTNGDVAEALQWLNELDKKYELTNDDYGIGDFVDELKDKGKILNFDPFDGKFGVLLGVDGLLCAVHFIFGVRPEIVRGIDGRRGCGRTAGACTGRTW